MTRIKRFISKIGCSLPKVTFHPLFVGYLVLLFCMGKEESVAISVLVILLHEIAHFLLGKSMGMKLSDVVLYPYGAVMEESCDGEKGEDWKVALAGPCVNLVCAIVGGCLLLLEKNSFLIEFVNANLTIALFNLLPVYPLDAGRAIISVSKKPIRCTKLLRAGGVFLSFCLVALFVLSIIFMMPNLTFCVMGLFLLVGALSGVEREMTAKIARVALARKKDYKRGVPVVKLACSEDMPVHKIVSLLRPNKVVEVDIISQNGAVKTISEQEILSFATQNSSTTPIGNILNLEG